MRCARLLKNVIPAGVMKKKKNLHISWELSIETVRLHMGLIMSFLPCYRHETFCATIHAFLFAENLSHLL